MRVRLQVDSVKENGGNVHIFSAMHVSGERLSQMSGVAAILRFPLPELEDEEEADEKELEEANRAEVEAERQALALAAQNETAASFMDEDDEKAWADDADEPVK